MSEKLDLEKMPDNALQRMFDDRTTDEVVADIVAAEPEKHGVTVAERLRRAKAEVIFDDTELAEEAAIRAAGGDPFEFLPGNRPRWTVDAGIIHDHLNNLKFLYDESELPGQQQGMATLSSPEQTGDVAAPTIIDLGEAVADRIQLQATCAHDFGEDPQDSTPCAKCKITFEDWANL